MAYMQYCPSSNPGSKIPVQVVPLTEKIVHIWVKEIQPYIKTQPNRSDVNWRWGIFYMLTRLIPQIKGYAILTKTNKNTAIPAGLILCFPKYKWLADHNKLSSFVWFITSAPNEILKTLDVDNPPKVGRCLLDTAVQISMNAGYQGRIGLHAAPAGGNKLMSFYRHLDMLNLERNIALPAGPARLLQTRQAPQNYQNDGRFFYTDERAAAKITLKGNIWR